MLIDILVVQHSPEKKNARHRQDTVCYQEDQAYQMFATTLAPFGMCMPRYSSSAIVVCGTPVLVDSMSSMKVYDDTALRTKRDAGSPAECFFDDLR